jgi:carbohydrate-binding DOMON domain-containing protein
MLCGLPTRDQPFTCAEAKTNVLVTPYDFFQPRNVNQSYSDVIAERTAGTTDFVAIFACNER